MIQGKVRDIHDEGSTLLLVSTNRLSAFDRHICDIPLKGIVLNQLSAWWFDQTKHIIPHHVLEIPTTDSMRVKKCQVFPIEMIVRGYITGSTNTSLWTLYQQGERSPFGNQLPEGLQKNQKLSQAILTPTTKSADHDRPLNLGDLKIIPGLTAALWKQMSEAAIALFQFASQQLASRGLILADTKYEFGLDEQGQLCLIDEIHTPDSSRYWSFENWESAFGQSLEPASYDKEIIRLWYREHCDPYTIKDLPKAPEELIQKVSQRYQELYKKITNRDVPH